MAELGTRVRDRITGFTGIITGVCYYISGCNQAMVVPPVDDQGKRRESEWFDVQRLERLDDSNVVLDNDETPGCDAPPPKR